MNKIKYIIKMQKVIHFLSSLSKKYLSLQSIHQLSIVCRDLKIYRHLLNAIRVDQQKNKNYYIKNIVPQIMAANYIVQYDEPGFQHNYAYCRNNKVLAYGQNKAGNIYIQYRHCVGHGKIDDAFRFEKVCIYWDLSFYNDNNRYTYHKNTCNHLVELCKKCKKCPVEYYLQCHLYK